MIANETATTTAVPPRAIARLRHSRRTTNHSSPTPGVIFVSSTIDQVHGQRKPSTMAAARTRWTLPPASSMAARTTPTTNQRRAGHDPHGQQQDAGPHGHVRLPRQHLDRREQLQERRRIDVRDGVRPVGAQIGLVVRRDPVAIRVLAGAPQPSPRRRRRRRSRPRSRRRGRARPARADDARRARRGRHPARRWRMRRRGEGTDRSCDPGDSAHPNVGRANRTPATHERGASCVP